MRSEFMPTSVSCGEKRREKMFKRRSNEGEKLLAFIRVGAYDRRTNAQARLEFRILGPLEVMREARALQLGSPKQRALLGFLLLHANEAVSRDRLVDELWGDGA